MHWIALQPQPEAGDASLPDAQAALGWWALQFTPKVAQLGHALLLEVSASERLWGGRQALVQHIFEEKKPVAVVLIAQGATSLIAYARLQGLALAHTAADDLPLSALAAATPHLATLARLGCTRWGQLRALPRGGVARRWGAPLLEALDRAYGHKPEVYPWLVLPEVFEAQLELIAQVETAPALLFGARRLLQQLRVWLQLRQSGVLALSLRWTMDARRHTATEGELVLRTAEPMLDMGHLERLLGEHLARVTLPAPVLYLHLRTLETKKLGGTSASLLPEDLRPGDSLAHLLERLSARLGRHQVLQWQACADHRPERMQTWLPVMNDSQLIAVKAINTPARGLKGLKIIQNLKNVAGNLPVANAAALPDQALWPTWLLVTPLKLAVQHQQPQYQGPLTLLSGPQRMETGWWGAQDFALRDYFVARSERSALLLWLYRERLKGSQGAQEAGAQWYLQGVFA
jgi:protein ImuB